MLIIHGTAEAIKNGENVTKGQRYQFNLLSSNLNFEEQLGDIEHYFNSKGWDNIEIEESGLIDNKDNIEHKVLKEAYELAQKQGLAALINNTSAH